VGCGGLRPLGEAPCDPAQTDCGFGTATTATGGGGGGGGSGDADGDGASASTDCDDGDPAIYPGATDACFDAVDADCDGEDCLTWVVDFESGLPPEFTAAGDAGWAPNGAAAVSGVASAASENVGDDQSAAMELAATWVVDGDVSFQHTGSTEASFDELKVFVDGSPALTESGEWPWTQATIAVTAGEHRIAWIFAKDGLLSGGADRVWIDDVRLSGGAP
jgi:hypothetical protein